MKTPRQWMKECAQIFGASIASIVETYGKPIAVPFGNSEEDWQNVGKLILQCLHISMGRCLRKSGGYDNPVLDKLEEVYNNFTKDRELALGSHAREWNAGGRSIKELRAEYAELHAKRNG